MTDLNRIGNNEQQPGDASEATQESAEALAVLEELAPSICLYQDDPKMRMLFAYLLDSKTPVTRKGVKARAKSLQDAIFKTLRDPNLELPPRTISGGIDEAFVLNELIRLNLHSYGFMYPDSNGTNRAKKDLLRDFEMDIFMVVQLSEMLNRRR